MSKKQQLTPEQWNIMVEQWNIMVEYTKGFLYMILLLFILSVGLFFIV